MNRVITIANQKGGVGKTTTVINLGASLAAAEKRTLIVDFDPQSNSTSGLGHREKRKGRSVYRVLGGSLPLEEAILGTDLPFLFLLPSEPDLAGAEIEMVGMDGREALLRDLIGPLRESYDFILVDTPPSLGLLTLNGLVACDSVLVPLQCEYYALEGVSELMATLDRVRETLNSAIAVEGVLLTMYDDRTNLSRQVTDEVRKFFGDKVYRTVIPRNVRLGEAPSHGKPAILYDIRSKGAEAYMQLAQEVLEK
ncbi:MAG: ParA family protein [Acidobacteria bacterium]|nr:ParA family protein [Acidobacteriota bacterium]